MMIILNLFLVLRCGISFNHVQLGKGRDVWRFSLSSSLTSKQATSKSDYNNQNTIVERKLGSYERLLSRKVPGSDRVALSHVCAARLSWSVNHFQLVAAISGCVQRHPLLRVYIASTSPSESYFVHIPDIAAAIANYATKTIQVGNNEELEATWQKIYSESLNTAIFAAESPLWRITNIASPTKSVLVFTMNHGIDDQRSVHLMLEDMMTLLRYPHKKLTPCTFPPSIESAVAIGLSLRTVKWALFQLKNSMSGALVLPLSFTTSTAATTTAAELADPDKRTTIARFLSTPSSTVAKLKGAMGVTVTHALAAAVSAITARFLTNTSSTSTGKDDVKVRFLLSVGLRPFSSSSESVGDFTGGTVACASGAVDYILTCPSSAITLQVLKNIAQQSQAAAKNIINKESFVPESVQLMDLGFQYVDILQAVEIDAKNKANLGRGYTCGVSNMGLASFPSADEDGKQVISEVYYGTSHGRNGNLVQLSCLTVEDVGQWCGCLQFPYPVVKEDEADQIARDLKETIEMIATSSLWLNE